MRTRRRGRPAPPRGRQPPAPEAGRRRRVGARARDPRRDRVAQRLADRRCQHRDDGPAGDDHDAARRERPRHPRRRRRSAGRRRAPRARRAGGPHRRRGRTPPGPRHRPRRRDERPPAHVRRRRPPARARSCSGRRRGGASRADRWPTCSSSSPSRPTTPIAPSAGAPWPSPTCSTGGSTWSRSAIDAGTRAACLAGRRWRVGTVGRSPSSRPPAWRRPTPTTRSSTGSDCGRPGAPTGTACATGCGSSASRRGPMRPATAPRSAWPLHGPPCRASPSGRPTGTTGRRPISPSPPAARGPSQPRPTVALALVDVLRRPGAGQFALDHARILAPLGSIPDADERRAMVADLVDDLLAPLGTVVTPAGMRNGRSAGSVVVHGSDR